MRNERKFNVYNLQDNLLVRVYTLLMTYDSREKMCPTKVKIEAFQESSLEFIACIKIF